MAARQFKFVSPGVFLKEVDQSQLPRLPGNIGPVIIGRTRKGPALRPTAVNSYADFVEVFGTPMPGNQGDDPWRDGNGLLAPAYTHYAAKAYFAAGNNSPVTVVRLLGVTGDDAGSGADASAGWNVSAGNAWGLFTMPSSSVLDQTASLAAIVYSNESDFELAVSGTAQGSNSVSGGAGIIVESNTEKRIELVLTSGSTQKKFEVDFTEGSRHYIRSVLNTNPVMTNTAIATANNSTLEGKYFLGQTFETSVSTDKKHVFVLPLGETTSGTNWTSYKNQANQAKTGWVICQDEGLTASFDPADQDKLFRFEALSAGEEFSKNYIVGIDDIKIPSEGSTDPYGTFSVVVKQRFGTRLETVESFPGCNLNPNSQNYIGRQVGDQYVSWSSVEKRNKLYGNYPNRSRFIRADITQKVDAGLVSPSKVPFGFLGPLTPEATSLTFSSGEADVTGSFLDDSPQGTLTSSITTGSISVKWPGLPSVVSGSTRGVTYFGASPYKLDSDGAPTSKLEPGMIDFIRRVPDHIAGTQDNGEATGILEHAFKFSLDDVVVVIGSDGETVEAAYHKEGARVAGDSYSATASAAQLVELGFDKFQMTLDGGCDGVNITEADPFNNSRALAGGTSDKYAYASVDRALELIRDPEAVEFNLAVMPGITNDSLTTKLVQTCESRADAMAIIDLPSVFLPAHELECTDGFQDRIATTPLNAAKALKKRSLNSSYGATYYPWVKISDTENTRELWAPPSVVALGVMAYTEKRDEVWFAPAGFNRGGLNEGNAGIPVLQVSEQLLSKQRDVLYEANINPIASFVTEGLVVFGQKTLQSTPSALDRINVRRLLIFVKKEVSRIASGLLFDQNVPATWNRFLGQVNPFLQSVKTRLGLSDFKVILDNSTTTPDLVDRNVMYAKIFLKPARAIEFIAVDFVITNTGASFDD